MNRQVIDLGLILKQAKRENFSMATFDKRLELQKLVYLLQAFNVYIGYDFSWYMRGPYCTVLAANGFALTKLYDAIPTIKDVKFSNSKTQKQFENFQKFVMDKNIDELEIAASLHYQKRLKKLSDEEIKQKVTNKISRFKYAQINKMWRELEKCHLI